MGQVTLPVIGGSVYLDAAPIIYSVERHADFWALMFPVWAAAKRGECEIVTSELTLLETLVMPLKSGATNLVAAYETLLTGTDVRLLPVTSAILGEAAGLLAATNLNTPDAIQAASATATGCALIVTNDGDLRRVTGLNVTVLKDLV